MEAQPDRTDMAVSDVFHRLKRTVLLLCSVLVVIALATPKETGTLHMTIVDLELSMDLASVLLWLAATYYLVGFILEARVCIRLNSKIFAGIAIRSYEEAVGDVARQLRKHAEFFKIEVPKIHDNLLAQISSLNDTAKQLETGPESLASTSQSGDREGNYMFYRTASEEQVAQREDAIAFRAFQSSTDWARRSFESVQAAFELHQPAVQSLAEEAKEAAREAEKAHRDLTRLNDLILSERRWSFWLWEIGGPSLAFVAATLALPYPASIISRIF